MFNNYTAVFILLFGSLFINAQEVAILKYDGGGDWYSNPTALPNLVQFCNQNIGTTLSTDIKTVEAQSIDIFQFPFIHMTGHGNVVFNSEQISNLRNYLLSGGFIHIDDNYGMKPYLEKRYEVYNGVADLYTYFFELGLRILKPNTGRMGYISSATFFKTSSGKNLRQYLSKRRHSHRRSTIWSRRGRYQS